jgi:hypothetical protein
MARRTRAASIQFELDVGLGQWQAWRAAVHHRAYGRAMRFAEVGHTENFA